VPHNLLTETQVAQDLRVSLACLRRWRLEKRGPIFVKLGSLVRYRPEDIEAWLMSLPTGGSKPGGDREPASAF
jgi:predicted DNA-binding transcriptional regulator AlpA